MIYWLTREDLSFISTLVGRLKMCTYIVDPEWYIESGLVMLSTVSLFVQLPYYVNLYGALHCTSFYKYIYFWISYTDYFTPTIVNIVFVTVYKQK